MAFRFSLATVLRFRESVERREELALQQIVLEIARTRIEIERLTEEMSVKQEAINKALQQPITAMLLQVMLNEANEVIARKKLMTESLVPLEHKRQAQMLVYQAAHRARQMLSEMEDRQRGAYELESTRAQQKFVDDLFAARMQRG